LTRRRAHGQSPRVQYGPSFRAEHVLEDGTRVTVRLIEPADKDELRRQFTRLSPESRYRRFFHAVTELSDETLDYLTLVDTNDHLAVVALVDSLDMKKDEGVGVGRFVRLAEAPDIAEAAVTVVDDFQRRGLGKVLLETLAEAAKERGIRKFRGEVLTSNAPMRRLLEEAGATAEELPDGTTVFDVPLETANEEPLPLKVLRAVAGSMLVWLSHLYPKARS
jgi:GNAT superfamily N-acetyltransferase